MQTEILTDRPDMLIRRAILEPGECSPWHVDICRRFTVVVCGHRLAIEYRDVVAANAFDVWPGMADWDEPDERVHRAVNIGSTTFEEVVTFYRDGPEVDPQPEVKGR